MKLKMSRVMFCQQCYEAQRPHDELLFAVLGSTNQKVWVYYYEAPFNRELIKPYGYTPHFVVLDKVLDGIAHILVTCACNECGVDIRYSQEKGWEVDIIKTIPMTLPLKDYLALEQFTDTGYKL